MQCGRITAGDYWFVEPRRRLCYQFNRAFATTGPDGPNDIGEDEPVSTREFGFGPAVGCVENMGRRQVDRQTTPYANGRATYQQGDAIQWEIVRADPVQLGGGQTGDDTLTFGVRGSVVGALADTRSSPRRHRPTATADWHSRSRRARSRSRSATAGRSAPRAASSLAHRLRIVDHSRHCRHGRPVRRGHGTLCRWRHPSWADGDVYQLKMLATSGAGRARPSDESMAWTGSTKSTSRRQAAASADTLMLALHHCQHGNGDAQRQQRQFRYDRGNACGPGAAGTMALLFASATCAKWRLTINEPAQSAGLSRRA